jgi:hypothetical protein
MTPTNTPAGRSDRGGDAQPPLTPRTALILLIAALVGIGCGWLTVMASITVAVSL